MISKGVATGYWFVSSKEPGSKIDEMVITIIISTAEVTGSTVSIVVVWACLGRLIGVLVRTFSVTTIFGKLLAL